MPYYIVIVKEKGRGGKTTSLPDPVFAPCVSEAWDLAIAVAPKDTMVYDVVPEEDKKRRRG